MTTVLRVGDRNITAEELIPLLAEYQLLQPLIREVIIDEAIASIECTPEETNQAVQQFCQKKKITEPKVQEAWLKQQGMSAAQLEALATRALKIEKYKQATWSHKLESYFLSRKIELDRVIYSLIRTKDPGIAQELYFRIQEGEHTFADLAREYSQGPEAQTGGLVGPVELTQPHPALAKILRLSKAGQLSPPTRLGEWLVIIRLEELIPAQLDDAMRQRLINDCFNIWLSEQVNQQLVVGDEEPVQEGRRQEAGGRG
ncbi:MAG: peptidylprolyl isomerase [Symploca sp. SIO2C1]|nr:peptidylprolyl isomerase [Symploca sp. SIO2C1]